MAEPSRKIEQEYLRWAVDGFDMRFGPEIERKLSLLNLDLFDIQNVLATCLVIWSNKEDARGAFYGVEGTTTEGDQVKLELWIDADEGVIQLNEVSPASGAIGDANGRSKRRFCN